MIAPLPDHTKTPAPLYRFPAPDPLPMPSPAQRRLTVLDLAAAKASGRRLSMVTAYDWTSARLVDAAGIDCVLVGDSVAMVVAGRSSTIPATLEQMIYHGEIVARAAERAFVVVDLPFPYQHLGVRAAVKACARLLKETGCQGVKLEGTAGQADVIAGIAAAGIPVIGHVGLRPQAVHQLGGYRMQRDLDRLMAAARAAADAGAFSVLMECIPEAAARAITAELAVPTFGIGAGAGCDGQVLVFHDLVGLSLERVPKFARAYADAKGTMAAALEGWRKDVEAGRFPGPSETRG